MQVFVREHFTMIAAPVQCDVEGIPKGSHYVRVPIVIGRPNVGRVTCAGVGLSTAALGRVRLMRLLGATPTSVGPDLEIEAGDAGKLAHIGGDDGQPMGD